MEYTQRETAELRRLVAASRRIVFFGGAGVSTESGIPDFRSTGGLYRQEWDYPPETILSRTFFRQNTAEFFRFYRAKMLAPAALPNAAHDALARLEQDGALSAVVTQNIDGLHQKAGSKNVFELHGSVHRNHCAECGTFYPLSAVAESTGIPRCAQQGCCGIIKPDVVLYEESLNAATLDGATKALADADLLIIGGTSLTVYPAAGLVRYFRGVNGIVVINKSDTAENPSAALVIRGSIGQVFAAAFGKLDTDAGDTG